MGRRGPDGRGTLSPETPWVLRELASNRGAGRPAVVDGCILADLKTARARPAELGMARCLPAQRLACSCWPVYKARGDGTGDVPRNQTDWPRIATAHYRRYSSSPQGRAFGNGSQARGKRRLLPVHGICTGVCDTAPDRVFQAI